MKERRSIILPFVFNFMLGRAHSASMIQGVYNPTHIIRLFLENEYAFSITYKTGVEVRVSHHKGTWLVGRLKDNTLQNFFDYGDNGDVNGSNGRLVDDQLVRRMVEEITRSALAEYKGTSEWREGHAFALERALRVFGGKVEDIERIDVVQPGRNAVVDYVTGEFALYPREDEFSK